MASASSMLAAIGFSTRAWRSAAALVIGAQAIPAVELEAFGRELCRALAAEPRQDGLQRLLLGDAVRERVLAAQARGGSLRGLMDFSMSNSQALSAMCAAANGHHLERNSLLIIAPANAAMLPTSIG